MKTCLRCKVEKKLDFFGKNKSKSDGKDSYCKDCNNRRSIESNKSAEKKKYNQEYSKKYRESNKDRLSEYNINYYQDNKEEIQKNVKNYSLNNKRKIRNNKAKYREVHKEEMSNYSKKYSKENKEILREYFRIYRNNKRKSDVVYKLKDLLRHRISEGLKSKGFTKTSKTTLILGCSIIEFKLYIESKFESWMTWDNYGKFNGEFNYGWDIDHIIPLNFGKIEEDIINLCHHTNLQPLCSYTNRYIKKDNIK